MNKNKVQDIILEFSKIIIDIEKENVIIKDLQSDQRSDIEGLQQLNNWLKNNYQQLRECKKSIALCKKALLISDTVTTIDHPEDISSVLTKNYLKGLSPISQASP